MLIVVDFDCACRARPLYFHNTFQVSFVAPLFTYFGVESILLLFKTVCRYLFMFNIELVLIELLMPCDVLVFVCMCDYVLNDCAY